MNPHTEIIDNERAGPLEARSRPANATPRSMRVPLNWWTAALDRARVDRVSISVVINRFLEGYVTGHLPIPAPSGTEPSGTSAHSIRVPDDVWDQTAALCGGEVREVIKAFLDAYGADQIPLPRLALIYQ